MNTLYSKAKRKWDNLVDRASKSKLTFNDTAWFKGSDLGQALNGMKIPAHKIRDLQKDIEESLQIDAYVEFVEDLTFIVYPNR